MVRADERDQRTGSILVCPLSAVPRIVASSNACRLITCLQEEIAVVRPQGIEPDKHLRLSLHDIAVSMPGCVAPSEAHIATLIAFARAWGGEGAMVVHCWAGISRSTAAAFTALCAINPHTCETAIATRLRQASPTAQPNRLMVEIADHALGRQGRMLSALQAIGPGQYASEALPFALPADQSVPGR
jgi:predicted protein tyrosine phosphatase